MRLMMTDEMLELYEQVSPYYDFNQEDCLRIDTPEEIRQKSKRLVELGKKQREEAMKIEYGFWNEAT